MFLLRVFPWNWVVFGGLLGLLFWVALLALAVLVIASIARPEPQRVSASSNNALEILKERYARGEISKEDFENMRRTLMA
jgi:putative membrane protein